jgi:hypothetical protein
VVGVALVLGGQAPDSCAELVDEEAAVGVGLDHDAPAGLELLVVVVRADLPRAAPLQREGRGQRVAAAVGHRAEHAVARAQHHRRHGLLVEQHGEGDALGAGVVRVGDPHVEVGLERQVVEPVAAVLVGALRVAQGGHALVAGEEHLGGRQALLDHHPRAGHRQVLLVHHHAEDGPRVAAGGGAVAGRRAQGLAVARPHFQGQGAGRGGELRVLGGGRRRVVPVRTRPGGGGLEQQVADRGDQDDAEDQQEGS